MATSVAPLTTTVMNSVPESHAGLASGINNAVSRTAGLFAVAILSIILLYTFNAKLDRHLSSLAIPPEIRQSLDIQRAKLAGAMVPENASAEMQQAMKQAISESFVSAFRLVMFVAAALAMLSALSAWILISN